MTQRRSGLAVAVLVAGPVLLATPAQAQEADRDCPDFSSAAAAQSYFDSRGPGDPDRLDADGDGLACEDAFGSSAAGQAQPGEPQSAEDQGSAQRQAAAAPQGGVAAGGGGMADPSSTALPAAGALLGTLLVGVGLTAARRRPTVD